VIRRVCWLVRLFVRYACCDFSKSIFMKIWSGLYKRLICSFQPVNSFKILDALLFVCTVQCLGT